MYEKTIVKTLTGKTEEAIATLDVSLVVSMEGDFYRNDNKFFRTLFANYSSSSYNWCYVNASKQLFVACSHAGTFYITIRYTK